MNRNSALHQARLLVKSHGIDIPVELDGGKRRMGATHFRNKEAYKISLSRHFIDLLGDDEIRNIVLHEIAHVKAGRDAGHGPVFRMHARALGISTNRCGDPSDSPDPVWIGTCSRGHTTGLYRAPTRVRSCGMCSRTWSLANVYTWKKNGIPIPHDRISCKYAEEYERLRRKHS